MKCYILNIYNYVIQITLTLAPSKELGLMYQSHLPERTGMLFVYDKPQICSIWMKNTYIPLDILFIDDTFTIVSINSGMPLDETTISSSPHLCNYVIELPYGTCNRHHIKPGCKIIF